MIPHGNDKFTLNIPCTTPGELLLKQKLSLAKVAYIDVAIERVMMKFKKEGEE